ncbi:MAG: antibiotic biosynthesis monooxygenase [Ilumatobacteraceae bacterium]|nr:antibiotic biosynthesis monooxygenase [Ilumatobacteraceae bacterium]
MIIVTGTIVARPDTRAEVLRMSLEHVHRSRLEPGCLLHSVHQDVEDPDRIVFIEHWADQAALFTHFAVPDSRAFARAAEHLAAERSTMTIYDATVVPIPR